MSSYRRTLRDPFEVEDTGTFRGATGTITTEANLVFEGGVPQSECLAPSHLLHNTYVNEGSLVARRSSLEQHGDTGVTNIPALLRPVYALRGYRASDMVAWTIPTAPGRTVGTGYSPGPDFITYDYGNDTSVVLPYGAVEPGTGVWNADTYVAKIQECQEVCEMVGQRFGTSCPEFRSAPPPPVVETPLMRGEREQAKHLFLARYLHEFLRFGRPVGLTTFVNAKASAHEYAISLFVHGATTTHNRQNVTFFPLHPVYCMVPMSVEMKAEVSRILSEEVALSIPTTTKLVVPEGRSYVGPSFMGTAHVEEFNLVPVSMQSVLNIFKWLPREEFDSAMRLAYIGRVTAGSGDDQGVALNFKFSTRD